MFVLDELSRSQHATCRSCASRSSGTRRAARSTPTSTTRRRSSSASPQHFAGTTDRPPRRAHGRLRPVVVQPASLEHRAAAAAQPRGADSRRVRPARRRAARADHQRLSESARWHSIPTTCSPSSPVPRTRARCTTSATTAGCTTRGCSRRYVVRDGIPVMLIDEAEAVADAEHEQIMARDRARQASRPTFAAWTHRPRPAVAGLDDVVRRRPDVATGVRWPRCERSPAAAGWWLCRSPRSPSHRRSRGRSGGWPVAASSTRSRRRGSSTRATHRRRGPINERRAGREADQLRRGRHVRRPRARRRAASPPTPARCSRVVVSITVAGADVERRASPPTANRVAPASLASLHQLRRQATSSPNLAILTPRRRRQADDRPRTAARARRTSLVDVFGWFSTSASAGATTAPG